MLLQVGRGEAIDAERHRAAALHRQQRYRDWVVLQRYRCPISAQMMQEMAPGAATICAVPGAATRSAVLRNVRCCNESAAPLRMNGMQREYGSDKCRAWWRYCD